MPKTTRPTSELEFLLALAQRLTSTLDVEEIFKYTLSAVQQCLPDLQSGIITMLDQDARMLLVRHIWNKDPQFDTIPVGQETETTDTLFSQLALKNLEPVLISDLWDVAYLHERALAFKREGLRALLYIPFIVDGRPIGVLHVHYWHLPRQFTPDEVTLCQRIADQAASAIHNATLYTERNHQLRLAQMLQKIGTLLTTSLSLQKVYDHLFDFLAQIIDYDHVSLYLENQYSGQITAVAQRSSPEINQVHLSEHMLGEVWLRRIPIPPGWVVVPDILQKSDWLASGIVDDYRSWSGAVLMVKDQLIGLLKVASRTPNNYTSAMGPTIAAFANQAAIAISNAQLHDEVSQQADELAILHQIAVETAVAVEENELLYRTTEMITNKLYPYLFGFVMVEETGGRLIPHASFHGLPEQYIGRPILYESIVGLVIQTGEPKIIDDVKYDPLYLAGMPVAETRSVIVVPIKIDEVVVGAINAESPAVNAFNKKDLHFLMTLAGKIAVAIERAKLYETLLAQADSLKLQINQQTAELQAERDRTAAILASAGEGIILTDTQANILYMNPAMETMSGYSREELLDKPLHLLVNRHGSQMIFDELWAAISSSERWSGELKNEHKEGSTYDVTLTATPFADADGVVQGYVCVQLDISRLKAVDRLQAEFISNVTHELRTPLTNIKTYASLLQRGKSEKHERYFKILHQEINRLDKLIQDLLDVSRLDAEFVPDEKASTDIVKILSEISEYFAERIKDKALQFTLILPDQPLPPVHMGAVHLRKVIKSVIDNAICYTDNGGQITTEIQSKQRANQLFVCLQVQDTGPGISEKELPRLFDRFYRGDAARKLSVPGTGLGLAMTKKIVERYSGLIEVESEENQGTSFIIWLPIHTLK